MISNLSIKGFKSINDLNLDLKNLTLLVGMNSSGKSTAIQSLLLAIQSLSFNNDSPLNGILVSLGDFKETRNYITNSKEIKIRLAAASEDNGIQINFSEKGGKVKTAKSIKNKELNKFLKYQNKHIRYLSSHRIGTRDLYEVNYSQITDMGFLGEYAIDYFEKYKSKLVHEDLIKNKEYSRTLESQVNYWLSYILNGEIKTTNIEGTDSVKAEYRIKNNRYFRPKNVGAGLSYIISIIITLLSSQPGNLNIIENPEIHLHPRAQSRLMEFMAFVSSADVKLIIETHSDHIFNGLRKSIYQQQLSSNDIATYYFDLDNEGISKVDKVSFNDEGKVIDQIEGLFDQFDEDLDILLGID
ncbi:AAA family ATPase [Bacillus thuringiensis]|uniref:AAA family ATPase n=1 Tax=Bacillus thuringiensis TaxID=1428 RepID=A0AAW4HYQ7_BACTU|nr:AAA family ATPase [Bacillus thuringiensis]MBN9901368.1 AAA family ATPase [Bacillus thuringiensis]MDY7521679.1 AAA family ATPase [Bacillus thuringiensis]